MLRLVTLLIGGLFTTTLVMAACPAVPSAPSAPACASLTTLPWSTGSNLANGTSYGVGTTSNSCGTSVTFSGTNSLVGGDASTKVYIKNGETLYITGSINSSFVGSIYVLAGGTLKVDQNINGGNIYVYGTLIHNPSSNVDVASGASVYVASGGLYNAGNFNLTGTGKMIVEGSFVTTRLRTMNSTTSQFCLNNNGCAGMPAVDMWQGAGSGVPIFTTDNGSGYIYYTQNTCPTMVAGYTYTTSAGLTVCAPNLGTGTTCTAFGSATQKTGTNCTPSASCATVVSLPISLLYFWAKKTNEGVSLIWATSSQVNTSHFVILRSNNGQAWTEIGTENAREVKEEVVYSWLDASPLAGINYYKLQEVALDGSKADYSIVMVNFPVGEISFQISPNPSSGIFYITLPADYKEYHVEVVDVSGKLVGTDVFAPGKSMFPEVLPAGAYFVSVKLGAIRKTKKVFIQ